MTPLPSDGYHHPKLIHPVPADDYFYCRVSAFRHYAAGYVEDLLDHLALLTDTAVFQSLLSWISRIGAGPAVRRRRGFGKRRVRSGRP